MTSSFIWYELLTSDPEAAATFYRAVLGWTAKDSGQPGMDYRIFSTDGIAVAKAATLPLLAGFFTKAKGATRKERYPDNIAEDSAVLVPADGGIFCVFGDKDLLQLAGKNPRKAFRLDPCVGKEARHIVCLC